MSTSPKREEIYTSISTIIDYEICQKNWSDDPQLFGPNGIYTTPADNDCWVVLITGPGSKQTFHRLSRLIQDNELKVKGKNGQYTCVYVRSYPPPNWLTIPKKTTLKTDGGQTISVPVTMLREGLTLDSCRWGDIDPRYVDVDTDKFESTIDQVRERRGERLELKQRLQFPAQDEY